jgi:predicted DNA-binding protein YlxM (UPF0122 family)
VTREQLNGLYWEEGKSLHLIAEIYNVTDKAVHWKMKKFGINLRSLKEADKLRRKRT